MNYAIAIVCGLAFGIALGGAKYYFVWLPYAKGKSDNVYGRMAISFFINAAALSAVYFGRGWWPYPFGATIAAVAIGLSASSGIIAYLANKKAFSSIFRG